MSAENAQRNTKKIQWNNIYICRLLATLKKFLGILSYLSNYKSLIAANSFFNLLSTLFSLVSFAAIIPFLKILFSSAEKKNSTPVELSLSPDEVMRYVDYRLNAYITTHGAKDALLIICIAVVVLFLLKNTTRYMAFYFIAPVRAGVVRDLRKRVYSKILVLPLSYYSNERKGDLISRSTSDISEIEWSILGSIEMLFKEPVTFIIFLTTLFIMSPQLTVFVLILLPLSGYLISRIGSKLRSSAKKGQSRLGEIISTLEETISGMRIIKAFNAQSFMENRFSSSNDMFYKIMVRVHRLLNLASPVSEFMGAIVIVTILWFGGNLILDQNSTLTGEFFIAYIAIFSQLLPPAKAFSEGFFRLQKGIASMDRVNEILNADEKIFETENPVPVKKFTDSIELRNVNFSYGKEQVLKNINLKINKGQTIALVGQSGAGKSTLADLLPRFYDINVGEILIDNVNIKNYSLHDLRNLMGIVSQESILFNDTVFKNIALAMPNVPPTAVEKAARIANAHDFIIQLPEGYQTNIGERGSKLSGGQRQRLSIARAVLKNPPILILDEATSALDTESEKLVQDALNNLMKHRTTLVIAHRLSTIQKADLIIVMHEGKIAETGTHAELLSKNSIYKKLYDLQIFQSPAL
ncbi:MAG: putative multidrug export ATP-binding/permease protein [Bacteroidia bacterium]|nr:putative multidrug export ATP-binding/permease protein [Bacteroidia bacterium]